MILLTSILYRIILVVVILLIGSELFTQKKLATQMTAAMTIIPFILRMFMIV